MRVAHLMDARAGRPHPGGRAAAARGRLAAAVRAGDAAAAADLLSEVTLAPGALRRDLLRAAAAAGDGGMLALLLARAGPFGDELDDVVATLVRAGHWALAPALHAAAAPALAPKLLAAARAACGRGLEPHAGLLLWLLRATTSRLALDHAMADFLDAFGVSIGQSHLAYLGTLVAPAPGVCASFGGRAVRVWTEVFGALAAGSGWRRGGGGSGRSNLPVGAARFTRRMMRTVLETGDADLLAQALAFLEACPVEVG